jgi:hypothetical protein
MTSQSLLGTNLSHLLFIQVDSSTNATTVVNVRVQSAQRP